MCKRRRLDLPKLPSSPEEFIELLIDSPFSNNHMLTIREGNETAVVFATDLMVSKLKEVQTIHFDGTFKVVPRIFYQLWTVFIQYKGHAIPALHILMTAKSEQLYTALLLALKVYIPEFTPLFAVCDFEKAARNSFTATFPHIVIIGCWFHYTKAIHDKIIKLGLGKLYKTNKVFKQWIHQLMSLPFLLEDEICPTFLRIELQLLGLTDLELQLISSFKTYFSKTWIEGSQTLSVFYSEVITNNGAESYHKTLKSYIKINHQTIWKFLSSMNKVLSDHDLEVKRLDDGLQIVRIPKLKSRINADLRNHYKTNYLNKTYSTLEYINYISSTIGSENKINQNISIDQIEPEQSYSSCDEEPIHSRCFVCLQNRSENFALLHEGYAHAGFCEGCANKLHQLKHECPICREIITGIMRVFQ